MVCEKWENQYHTVSFQTLVVGLQDGQGQRQEDRRGQPGGEGTLSVQKISIEKFHLKNFTRKISLGKFHSKSFTQKISLKKFHSKNFTH